MSRHRRFYCKSRQPVALDSVRQGQPAEKDAVKDRYGKNMYLTRKDFRTHGHTPGCQGCLDIASGRPGPTSGLSPHTKACPSRMNEAIKAADPTRWEKYLRRRGGDPVDVEGPLADAGVPDSLPAIEEARAEEDDGWDKLWVSDHEEPAGPSEEDAGSGLGTASESLPSW